MHNKEIYWYGLPSELIAQEPASPRDSSRLLVYNTQTDEVIFDKFYNLATYLPPSTTLILNDARVVPARVTLAKETGGKIVVLFLINEWITAKKGPIPCFLDRKGSIGTKLYFPDKSFVTIQKQDKEMFYLSWEGEAEDLLKKLNAFGAMPVPPYIKHSPLSRDELFEKYQTVFAKKAGSSAAPTASLHFTPEVFASLEKKGIQKQCVTLHVGLGTFAPLTKENMRTKSLHHEWYEVPPHIAESLKLKAKSSIQDITAVGTTVVRTLESVKISLNQLKSDEISQDEQKAISGSTNLFIMPPYKFHAVNHLVTNFHLPNSSLMMLVEAFLQDKRAKRNILDLYRLAIKEKCRFYSFGDAMLIL